MGRAFGFIVLIVVVAIGGYVYTRQAQSVTSVGSNPQSSIEITAVRNDLLAIANAQRRYFASNGKYVSLDELQTAGDIDIPTRPNFSYSAQSTESTFKIVAVYSGSDSRVPKRITLDETMTLAMD